MSFDTLISCCDSRFAVRAYSNHLESVRVNYQKLKDLIAVAAITDPEDISPGTPSTYFTNLINEQGFSANACVTLPVGEFVLLDLLIGVYNGSEYYADNIDSDINFNINDYQGNPIGYENLIDSITSTLHSVTAAWAASASALEESISARISLFRDKMQTVFADAYDDVSQSIEYWTALLSENFTPSTWISNAIASMQLREVASTSLRIDETNLYEYTGASPIGALDWSTACNVAFSIGTVALTAYISICEGIMALGSKVFTWGKQKIIEVVSDPDDLYISNENAVEPACNDGYWCRNTVTWSTNVTTTYCNLLNVFHDFNELTSFINYVFNTDKYRDKWIHFKLICGEMFVRLRGLSTYGSSNLAITFDYKVRPYVLDYAKVRDFGQASGAPGSYSTGYNLAGGGSSTAEWVQYISKLQTADLYADSDSNEVDKCNGIRLALDWFDDIIVRALGEATGVESNNNLYSRLEATPYETVTNADFVKWCIGWSYSDGAWSPLNYQDDMVGRFIIAYMIHEYQRYISPLDYDFFPYTKDSEDFAPGQWSIKTNSQNWAAFNNFGTIAITAIIIVAAAIYAGVKVAQWKKRKYLARASFIGQIDNKMWSGANISSSDWNKYIRYTRKLNVSTLMDNRLARVKEVLSNIKDKISNISATDVQTTDNSKQIIKLITG